MEDRTAVTTAVMSLNPSPCLDSGLRAAHCGSTDMQHLQRLSPAYVTDVDALLSVVMTDSETPVEFPVHAAILSEHSPIMRDLLQATRDEQNAMASGKEPHIAKIVVPMVGDTVLEVQALLAAVYASKAVKAATPQQVVDSARPYHALTAAHKYGMAKLLQELESQLISEVTDLKKSSCPTGALKIIAYACAADKCHLERLTAHSEAYIVERFDVGKSVKPKPVQNCTRAGGIVQTQIEGVDQYLNQVLLRVRDSSHPGPSR